MANETSSDDTSVGSYADAPAIQIPQPYTTFAPRAPYPRPAVDDGIDIAQLWMILRENAKLIVAIAGFVFCAVMGLALLSHMKFKASGRLYLGELDGVAAGGKTDIDLSGNGEGDVASEIEIIRSRSLLQHAILDSGMNVTIAPPDWSPPRFWQWLLKDRDPSLLDVASQRVEATQTTIAQPELADKGYRVKFTTETDYVLSTEGEDAIQGVLGRPVQLGGLTLTLVAGTTHQRRAGAVFDLWVDPLEDVTDDVLERLQVSTPKPQPGMGPAKVVGLEYLSRSPLQGTKLLRSLMAGYMEARQSWKTEDATAAEAFVTQQLHVMQKSLDATQEKLAGFRTENRVVVLQNEGMAMVEQIGKYEQQRVAARLEAAALRDLKHALKQPNPPLEAYMFGEGTDVVLQGLARSLSESQQKLTELEAAFEGAAPNVKQQRTQVEAQLKTISNYVSNRLARAEDNVESLNTVIAGFENKLKTVPGAELGLAQIARESEVYSKMYSYLLERQQQSGIVKASTVSKNRILDFPQVPSYEDSPALLLRLTSVLLGLLIGAAFALLRSLLSGNLRNEHEVRAMLGPVPVFASVPQSPKRRRVRGARAPALFDVTAPGTDFGFAEAFRTLRTNLYHNLASGNGSGQGKIILVTSPSPCDGKTTCALSLAAMLAADGKRVLVIDSDLRKPSHHALTGLPQEPGLQGLLSGKEATEDAEEDNMRAARLVTWRQVVHTAGLAFGTFHSINAGVGARAELLSRRSLAVWLQRARARYDFILLDSPAYPLVSDPLILSALSDFVLSVIRLGTTSRKLTEEHLHGMFHAARGHAVVINNAEKLNAYEYYPAPAKLSRIAARRLTDGVGATGA